jgi:leader peptidase (prepilin peptidase) / N-methyltransferase
MIIPLLLLTILATTFGAVIGSFLNVVIHRVPRGESVVWPGSHCPACGVGIAPLDNLPLLSFILLRGRCRRCQSPISLRYPLVELATALIFGALVWKNGVTPETLIEMVFVGAILSLIVIDIETRTLPNIITYPLLLIGLLASLWRSGWGEPIRYSFDLSLLLVSGESAFDPLQIGIQGALLIGLAIPVLWLVDRLDLLLFGKYFEWEDLGSDSDTVTEGIEDGWSERAELLHDRMVYGSLISGLLIGAGWFIGVQHYGDLDRLAIENASQGLTAGVSGALVGALPVWLLRTFHFYLRGREGMGLGDVKLLAGIGAFLGWQGALGTILLGSISGSIVGLLLLRRSKEGLQTTIPFGCFLGLAALLILFKTGL